MLITRSSRCGVGHKIQATSSARWRRTSASLPAPAGARDPGRARRRRPAIAEANELRKKIDEAHMPEDVKKRRSRA